MSQGTTPGLKQLKKSWWKRRFVRRWAARLTVGAIVGLLAGAAGWRAEAALAQTGRERVVAGMGAAEFTRLVKGGSGGLKDVVVHPEVDGKHLVTGKRAGLTPQQEAAIRAFGAGAAGMGGNGEFEFVAPVPFVLKERTGRMVPVTRPASAARAQSSGGGLLSRLFGGAPTEEPMQMVPEVTTKTYPTVMAFLDEAAASRGGARGAGGVAYRYAWSEEPAVRARIWMGGGVGLFGLVLPVGAWALRRARVLQAAQENDDDVFELPAYAEEKQPVGPAVDHNEVAARLHAVTVGLEEKLGVGAAGADQGSPGRATSAGAAGAGAVVQLKGGPVEAAAEQAKEAKTFDRGEFYPVSRGKSEGKIGG